jgi:hypothetical protein
LLLLSVPLLEGRDNGWPWWMLVCLVLVAPAAVLFAWYERRLAARGGTPLVRVELFSNRGFAGGVPIAFLFMASYASFLLLLAIYLQAGLGFSPLHSGAVYTPAAIGFFITSLAAPRLVPLLGRHVLSIGYVTAALGLLATAATVKAAGSGLVGWELAPTLFLAGLGQGLGMSPLVGRSSRDLSPPTRVPGPGWSRPRFRPATYSASDSAACCSSPYSAAGTPAWPTPTRSHSRCRPARCCYRSLRCWFIDYRLRRLRPRTR